LFGIGGWELLVIAMVALIVLGPKGLPAAARAIGRAVSELRRATSDLRQSIELDPDLKDIPHALDELNRPLLSPSPYSRKRPPQPRDGPPEGLKEPPRVEAQRSMSPKPAAEASSKPGDGDEAATPVTAEPAAEVTTTKRPRPESPEAAPPRRDESEGMEG